MRILVWVAPWIGQGGDPLFFEAALKNHLMRQARALTRAGCQVTVVGGELLLGRLGRVDSRITVRKIPLRDAEAMVAGLGDPSVPLYVDPSSDLSVRIEHALRPIIGSDYDAVLVWETPVPYLERLLPDAVFLHQMPGAFSRPPYPHTIVTDPLGLYRHSAFSTEAATILSNRPDAEALALTRSIACAMKRDIRRHTPITRETLDPHSRFDRLVLLPLQVSGHYAFRADSGYASQSEFLLDVLRSTPREVGLVVTQYRSSRVTERVLTRSFATSLRQRFDNFIYLEEVDSLPTASQWVLPFVDAVCTSSSGLGFQALLWDLPLIVPNNTFLAPFADGRSIADIGSITSDPERCENVLAAIFNRHQPLFELVVDDGEFLKSLIEDRSKRRHADGIERLPRLTDLVPDYEERLFAARHPKTAARALRTVEEIGGCPPRPTLARTLRKRIADEGIEVVSFDLFDTLIDRPLSAPAHLFGILEPEALRISRSLTEFAVVRCQVETTARAAIAADEIQLADIYQQLQKVYDLDDSTRDRLISLEEDLERELCRARPAGAELWGIARAAGCRTAVVTDTCLPEPLVRSMLEKSGYGDASYVFVSSAEGVRKHSGRLFDRALRQMGAPPSRVLHVGDNPYTDGKRAREHGIHTLHLPRAVSIMTSQQQNHRFEVHPNALETGPSIINALVAHRLFNTSQADPHHARLFDGDPFLLGFAGLGPVVASFSLWLRDQVEEHGVRRLYFLSREGKVLRDVFNILHPPGTLDLATEYLYGSRRAILVANVRTKADIAAVASRPFADRAMSIGMLLAHRFGIEAAEVSIGTFRRAGYPSPDERVRADAQGVEAFRNLCLECGDAILERAAREREAYLAYLVRAGFPGRDEPGLVDLGWAGNMQAGLERLTDRRCRGYYYATLDTALRWRQAGSRLYGYAGSFASPLTHPSALVARRPISEYLLCCADPSLAHFALNDGEPRPVFLSTPQSEHRRALIDQVHRGICDFAFSLRERLGARVSDLAVDPFFAERWYDEFLRRPFPEDAQMLDGHYSEDSFGGIACNYLVAPVRDSFVAPDRDSYWKEGARAVRSTQGNRVGGAARRFASSLPRVARALTLKTEARLVRRLAAERKQNKYYANRKAFFEDSASPLARWWVKMVR